MQCKNEISHIPKNPPATIQETFGQIPIGTDFWLCEAPSFMRGRMSYLHQGSYYFLLLLRKTSEKFADIVGAIPKIISNNTCVCLGDHFAICPTYPVKPFHSTDEGIVLLPKLLDEDARRSLAKRFPLEGPCIVLCQHWIESEIGWGCRPDGYTLHVNEECRLFSIDKNKAWEIQFRRTHASSVYRSDAALSYWVYMVDRSTFDRLIECDGSMPLEGDYNPDSILLYVWGNGKVSTPFLASRDEFFPLWQARRLLTEELRRRFSSLKIENLPIT